MARQWIPQYNILHLPSHQWWQLLQRIQSQYPGPWQMSYDEGDPCKPHLYPHQPLPYQTSQSLQCATYWHYPELIWIYTGSHPATLVGQFDQLGVSRAIWSCCHRLDSYKEPFWEQLSPVQVPCKCRNDACLQSYHSCLSCQLFHMRTCLSYIVDMVTYFSDCSDLVVIISAGSLLNLPNLFLWLIVLSVSPYVRPDPLYCQSCYFTLNYSATFDLFVIIKRF